MLIDPDVNPSGANTIKKKRTKKQPAEIPYPVNAVELLKEMLTKEKKALTGFTLPKKDRNIAEKENLMIAGGGMFTPKYFYTLMTKSTHVVRSSYVYTY